MPADMRFTWTPCGHGWAECVVADDRSEARMLASYVTGGPEDLLTAVARLRSGAADAQADFEAEPTTYRWIFRRDGERADIQVLELPDRSAPHDDAAVIWRSSQRLDALARTIVRGFDRVAEHVGEGEYRVQWGRPFPRTELEALRAAWRMHP